MLCFMAGQYMVYAHQHAVGTGSNRSSYHNPNTQPKQTITENCRLCDAMHHNTMATNTQVLFAPVVLNSYTYTITQYDFVSIALVHSSGRAPPLA